MLPERLCLIPHAILINNDFYSMPVWFSSPSNFLYQKHAFDPIFGKLAKSRGGIRAYAGYSQAQPERCNGEAGAEFGGGGLGQFFFVSPIFPPPMSRPPIHLPCKSPCSSLKERRSRTASGRSLSSKRHGPRPESRFTDEKKLCHVARWVVSCLCFVSEVIRVSPGFGW